MKLKVRRVGDYADVTLEEGNAEISFGFCNNKELRDLLESFKEAVSDLEWVVNATTD